MKDIENIVEEYRNADAEKRLYLFLSYRSLRDEFIDIDQRDVSVKHSPKRMKNKTRTCCKNWGQRLIGALTLN